METKEQILKEAYDRFDPLTNTGKFVINLLERYADSENTALKLKVEKIKAIISRLQEQYDENGIGLSAETQLLRVEDAANSVIGTYQKHNKKYKEALEKILSHADPYDQDGNVFISIAEQALKEK